MFPTNRNSIDRSPLWVRSGSPDHHDDFRFTLKADVEVGFANVRQMPTAVVTPSARPQGRCSAVAELRFRDMDAFCTEICTSFSVTQEEEGSMRYVTIV